MDERVTELEMNYMHLQRTVMELNEVVYLQQQTIDRLAEELRLLKDECRGGGTAEKDEEEKPPPHY